jgi:FkbM family methyltransferase
MSSNIDYEGLIRDLYVRLLKPGDTAVDCGAHHGGHTFQMAQAVMPSGRILAVEASPECASHMRELMDGPYRHLAPAIDLWCIGLAAEPGEAPFYYAPEAPGLSGLRPRPGTISTPLTESRVQLTTLDLLCRDRRGPIRYIKVDVEGAEYDVLRGGAATICAHRPVITFEHNADSPQHFGYDPEAVMNLFRDWHYRVHDLLGRRYFSLAEAEVWDFVAFPEESPSII